MTAPAAGAGVNEFDVKAATWDEPAKVARAEEVARAIARELPLGPAASVLEYGAGTGLLGLALVDRVGQVTLADSSPGMLEVAQRKIAAAGITRATPRLLDLTRDPPPAERYDLVCSLLVLHHVADVPALLRAFHGLLRAPGHLALADLDREDGSFHGPAADVHRGFDRAVVAEQLRAAGFVEVRTSTACTIERAGRTYPVFLAVAGKASP